MVVNSVSDDDCSQNVHSVYWWMFIWYIWNFFDDVYLIN